MMPSLCLLLCGTERAGCSHFRKGAAIPPTDGSSHFAQSEKHLPGFEAFSYIVKDRLSADAIYMNMLQLLSFPPNIFKIIY